MARRMALTLASLAVFSIFLFIFSFKVYQVNKSSAEKITQFERALIECENNTLPHAPHLDQNEVL